MVTLLLGYLTAASTYVDAAIKLMITATSKIDLVMNMMCLLLTYFFSNDCRMLTYSCGLVSKINQVVESFSERTNEIEDNRLFSTLDDESVIVVVGFGCCFSCCEYNTYTVISYYQQMTLLLIYNCEMMDGVFGTVVVVYVNVKRSIFHFRNLRFAFTDFFVPMDDFCFRS